VRAGPSSAEPVPTAERIQPHQRRTDPLQRGKPLIDSLISQPAAQPRELDQQLAQTGGNIRLGGRLGPERRRELIARPVQGVQPADPAVPPNARRHGRSQVRQPATRAAGSKPSSQ
jgi:hypothetical protein